MTVCYIGLGSNLGERKANIESAIEKIRLLKDTLVTKISTIIESEPCGGPAQGEYLNSAIEIQTGLSPQELLSGLQNIEWELGRRRSVKNAARTIDLDILFFGNERINKNNLVLPHPRIKEREFVLVPLKEISCGFVERYLGEDSQKN